MPLVRTAVQDKPCVWPNENSDPIASYPLEIDQGGCTKDSQINKTNDERYIDTGSIGISEWDMQDDNDIIEKLISLPHYSDEVGDDYHAQKE